MRTLVTQSYRTFNFDSVSNTKHIQLQKILIVLVARYPYDFSESYFEGELRILAKTFDKVFIVIPEAFLINVSKPLFEVPVNAETVLVNNYTSPIHKFLALLKIFTKRALVHFHEVRVRYKLPLQWRIVKTMLAYEAKHFAFGKMLLKELKKRNLEISKLSLYTYWLNEYTFSLVRIKERHPSVKIFSRIHGWDLYFERHNPPYLPYRDYIIPKLDRLFPISENGKNYVINKVSNCDPWKISVQRLGTDVGKRIGYSFSDKIIILTISFLRPVKHMELLVEFLEKIDRLNIMWHHIGGGDDKYALNLLSFVNERLAKKSNVNYTFHGTRTKQQIEDFLINNAVDLMINTSYSEGIPVSIMQAMAFSIPAIAPDVGGMGEIIQNETNGFLLPSSPTSEDLECAIEKYFMLTASEKQHLRENAYSTWNEKYNSNKNYNQLSKALLEI